MFSMTAWHYTIVDAFTSTPFSGNQASIIILQPSSVDAESCSQSTGPGQVNGWPADELMLKIAQEFNLSETAYLLPLSEWTVEAPVYGLRWWTPSVEAPLVSA